MQVLVLLNDGAAFLVLRSRSTTLLRTSLRPIDVMIGLGRLRSHYTLAALLFIALFSAFFVLGKSGHHGLYPPGLQNWAEANNGITQDKEILESLNLTRTIEYRRRCIRAKPSRGVARKSLTNISWRLLARPSRIERDWLDREIPSQMSLPQCEEAFTLVVPRDNRVSHKGTETLILGVATTLERLNSSLPEMSRWLANTASRLLVHLRDSPEDAVITEVQQNAEALNMDVTILPPTDSEQGEAESNFALANALYHNRKPNTRWFGVIDDDTFFLSISSLLQALSPYDPALPWYIGGLTERHLGISTEGFKAWGGAGIFFSPPLLEILAAHSDECMSLSGTWGDALWRDCLVRFTSPTVKLTPLKGLNQLDMFGDMAGWYESGPDPLLTIHHWKSWHDFPVPMAHIVTDVSGTDSFLQRYRDADGLVLSNGFSLVRYPRGLPDLNLIEGTMFPYPGSHMPQDGGEFLDSLGALRPVLEKETEKITWNFTHAVKTPNGCVRQFYVHRYTAPEGEVEPGGEEVDSVVELDWCKG